MNIQSIQIAQGLLSRAVEGKINPAKGNASAESGIPVQEINLPAAKENKILPENSNSSKTQGNTFAIIYPPFFPMGSTQGIYTAMMEAEPNPSSSEAVQPQKADDKTEKTNANAIQQQVANEKDVSVENNPPKAKQASDPGSVLDLKV